MNAASPLTVQVILGSTRDGRFGDKPDRVALFLDELLWAAAALKTARAA